MITQEILRTIPLLAVLDDSELNELAANVADVHVNAGEWVIHEGQQPAFFFILSGDVDITKSVGGEEQELTQYHPGDYFGEVPLLLGSNAVASVRAKNDVHLLRLDPLDFHNMMVRSETLAAAIVQTMALRVANIQRIAIQTPIGRTLVVGHAWDHDCYGMRQFLSNNRQRFRWLDPEDKNVASLIPEAAGKGPFPAVVFMDGTVLCAPSRRDVAERLGLPTTPKSDMYDVIIIGGGPAGLTAAVYGASEGLRTLMIDREAPGGQAGESSRIENYLGFPAGLSGSELSDRALKQAKRFGAEVVVTRVATEIKTDQPYRQVVLDGNLTINAHTIVLATGVSWRPLPVPGAEKMVGRGVYYGAARTEALGVRGKDVYLIGGGNSAGQAAMFFADYAHRVTLLIRSSSIEKGMSQYLIAQLHTKSNVFIRLNSNVTAVHGSESLEAITVRDNATQTEEILETSALFVFIGADAETDWLPADIACDERGYILTGPDAQASGKWSKERDPYLLETSVPCVFAAGDVRHGSIKRVASSVGEGSMAIAFVHQCLALG